MADYFEITGNFDGGNPKDQKRIIQTGLNSFDIAPFSEDGDPNYKFRLDIKVVNRSSSEQHVNLHIKWREPRFNHLRNFVYLKNDSDGGWSRLTLAAGIDDTTGRIRLKPGETHITLNPKYDYADYIDLVSRVPQEGGVVKELVGRTPEKREIWALKTRNSGDAAKKRIMLVARIHPYETSGSYCTEGIVDHLLNSGKSINYTLTRNCEICIIPMANPDGVYNGLCKLTCVKGTDFSKILDFENPITLLMKKAIDDFKPDIYCEFHNWMLSELDGIYYLNRLQAWRFKKNMPSQKRFQKRWRVFVKNGWLATEAHGFKKYCREKFGSIGMCVEYPWYRRNASDMKRLGIQTLESLCRL